MERKVFISYLKNDSNDSRFAEDLRRALERHDIHVVNDANSEMNVALFVLTHHYLVNAQAMKEAEMLLKRRGVWCIPIYYGIIPVQVGTMWQDPNAPQIKSIWQDLNELCTPVYEDGRLIPDADSVVKHIRQGSAQPEKVYDVFLSHAGEVKPFCKKLKSALESQRSFSVFLDVFAIRGGPGPMSFPDEIKNGIAKSKIVVVILSHHFESKFWTTEEIRLCREKGVRVFPVYYHISREMCVGRLEVAGDREKENLNWLFQQPGIEHYGKHAGEQLEESMLVNSIVDAVGRYIG